MIAVNISRQKELDADPKAIQHIAFAGQLKKCRLYNKIYGAESMFVLTILELLKELKFSQGSVTIMITHKQLHN